MRSPLVSCVTPTLTPGLTSRLPPISVLASRLCTQGEIGERSTNQTERKGANGRRRVTMCGRRRRAPASAPLGYGRRSPRQRNSSRTDPGSACAPAAQGEARRTVRNRSQPARYVTRVARAVSMYAARTGSRAGSRSRGGCASSFMPPSPASRGTTLDLAHGCPRTRYRLLRMRSIGPNRERILP